MDIDHLVAGTTYIELYFARFMDIAMELVGQVYDDEVVRHFESNYRDFISDFSPAGPAFCIDNFAAEEIESRNMKRIASRSATAKIPALGFYLRKDLSHLNEDDIESVQWGIVHILAASYLGSAVFAFDTSVESQSGRSPEELMNIWGPAAYLFTPYDLGFTEEPLFFKLVAMTTSEVFFQVLKSLGVSTKGKLKAMIGCYVIAGHILRRLDVCEPGAEPLPVILQANWYNQVGEETQVREEPRVERPAGKKPWYSGLP